MCNHIWDNGLGYKQCILCDLLIYEKPQEEDEWYTWQQTEWYRGIRGDNINDLCESGNRRLRYKKET